MSWKTDSGRDNVNNVGPARVGRASSGRSQLCQRTLTRGIVGRYLIIRIQTLILYSAISGSQIPRLSDLLEALLPIPHRAIDRVSDHPPLSEQVREETARCIATVSAVHENNNNSVEPQSAPSASKRFGAIPPEHFFLQMRFRRNVRSMEAH